MDLQGPKFSMDTSWSSSKAEAFTEVDPLFWQGPICKRKHIFQKSSTPGGHGPRSTPSPHLATRVCHQNNFVFEISVTLLCKRQFWCLPKMRKKMRNLQKPWGMCDLKILSMWGKKSKCENHIKWGPKICKISDDCKYGLRNQAIYPITWILYS